ncbi:MAG: hypothetical protein QOI10_2968 [Solirubrobacterales bacterium]|jgi:hypothetical protein|nr:hypothetical protein [Solirubrobacterales bacterium]
MDEPPLVCKAVAADTPGDESEAKRSDAAFASQEGPILTEIRGRLKDLKREIELNQYDVDAGAVADAILLKLRLLRHGREAMAISRAGRSPRAPGAPRAH